MERRTKGRRVIVPGVAALAMVCAGLGGCAQYITLSPNSAQAAAVEGQWKGSWESGPISGTFTLDLRNVGGGGPVTAVAVWYGAPTIRHQLSGRVVDGQLVLGDPATQGLTLTFYERRLGGLAVPAMTGFELRGQYMLSGHGRTSTGSVQASRPR
jgi:hypothetical protein